VAVLATEAVFVIERSGAGVTVKLVPLDVLPAAFVTLMTPVVAPAGTVATICTLLTAVNDALTPLNFTSVDE
jgi:hypothetical protein